MIEVKFTKQILHQAVNNGLVTEMEMSLEWRYFVDTQSKEAAVDEALAIHEFNVDTELIEAEYVEDAQ